MRCERHGFVLATDVCERCGLPFCEGCLVWPFPKKPPLCVRCALVNAGIRSGRERPPEMPRKQVHEHRRELEQWRADHADLIARAAILDHLPGSQMY